MNEQALLIPCRGDEMLGILSPGSSDLAVLVVVGGPQYRAGSHRLFVQLCRHLAQQGICSLRFDVRGMGDSTGTQRNFEQLSDDVAAALDTLQEAAPHVRRVILWGLCDGASASLLYLHERQDARIAGLCLLNPWVRSEQSLARTHVKHYYLQRLREPDFWRKLASGGVGGAALRELWGNVRRAADVGSVSAANREGPLPFAQRMALGLLRFGGPVQLVLSQHDYTAREFEDHSARNPAWQQALLACELQRVHLPHADHTLSSAADVQALLSKHQAWLEILLQRSIPSRAA